MAKKTLRWGIIGLGKIANKFALALKNVEGVTLYAVASRDLSSAEQFAQKYNATIFYDSYLKLVEDPNVDVVYIATPHAFHKEHTLLCLQNKKPVLCEKPLAHKLEDVQQMIQASRTTDTFLMEAMWTRFLPPIHKALELIHGGHIGQLISIEADFGFNSPFNENGRLYDMKLGGGSLMDVGVYPLFLALTILGRPKTIQASAVLSVTGADTSCAIELIYDSANAFLKSSIVEDTKKEAVIIGTEGWIRFYAPWYHPTTICLEKMDGTKQEFDFGYEGNGFEMQIKEVQECLENGKLESTKMSHQFSLMQSELLDLICKQCKIVYP